MPEAQRRILLFSQRWWAILRFSQFETEFVMVTTLSCQIGTW